MADKTILVRYFSNLCVLVTKLFAVPNYKLESRVRFPDGLVACHVFKKHLGKERIRLFYTSVPVRLNYIPMIVK